MNFEWQNNKYLLIFLPIFLRKTFSVKLLLINILMSLIASIPTAKHIRTEMRKLGSLFRWHWFKQSHLSPHWSRMAHCGTWVISSILSVPKTNEGAQPQLPKSPTGQPTGRSYTQNWRREWSVLKICSAGLKPFSGVYPHGKAGTSRKCTTRWVNTGRLLQQDIFLTHDLWKYFSPNHIFISHVQ